MNIIVAMTYDGVIGMDNSIPWSIPEDMKLFRRTTLNKSVIMGRKTYESIGKPLPKRENIVVSSKLSPREGIIICSSLDEALEKASCESFVIGGHNLYKEALPLASDMYISFVKGCYVGDTNFPEFDPSEWDITEAKDYEEFSWTHFRRRE